MNSRESTERRDPKFSRSISFFCLFAFVCTGCFRQAGHQSRTTEPDASISSVRQVVAAMTVTPAEVVAGGTVEIVVPVTIASGSHIYATNDADRAFVPTTLDLTLPDGVEALSAWIMPEPIRRNNGDRIYTQAVAFHRTLRVAENVLAKSIPIQVSLHFQVCTEDVCWPPQTITFSSQIDVLQKAL